MLMLFCIGFVIAKPVNTELAKHWAPDFSNMGNRATLGLNPSACVDIPSYNYSITPGLSWYTTSSSIVAGDCKIFRVSVSPNESYTFKTGCGDGATALPWEYGEPAETISRISTWISLSDVSSVWRE